MNYVLREESGTLLARPVGRENVKVLEQASLLTSSCEGDNGVQVFLPFANRTKNIISDSLTWGNEAIPVFASTFAPHRAPRQFVWPSTPGKFEPPRHTPHWWDEFQCPNSAERGLWSISCGSPLSTTDQSLHGFADGSSGCQSTGSFPGCSSVCGCTPLAVLRGGRELC